MLTSEFIASEETGSRKASIRLPTMGERPSLIRASRGPLAGSIGIRTRLLSAWSDFNGGVEVGKVSRLGDWVRWRSCGTTCGVEVRSIVKLSSGILSCNDQ